EDGIRDFHVTGVQTCALPISRGAVPRARVRAVMQGPTPQNPSSAPGAVAAITHARFPGLARRLPWLVLALLAAFPLLAPALGLRSEERRVGEEWRYDGTPQLL